MRHPGTHKSQHTPTCTPTHTPTHSLTMSMNPVKDILATWWPTKSPGQLPNARVIAMPFELDARMSTVSS